MDRVRSRAGFAASALACAAVAALAPALPGCAREAPREAWQEVELPTDAEFAGLWFTDSLAGWMTGGGFFVDGGLVGRTRDGGLTWSFTNPLPPGAGGRRRVLVRRLHALDSSRAVAATDEGMLLTEDGGRRWRAAAGSDREANPLFDVQLLDDRVGWAVGGGGLLETSDGGASWRLIGRRDPYEGGASGTAVHFTDPYRGVLVGLHGLSKRTVDGGRTWAPLGLAFDPGPPPRLYDVHFADARHGWIVGEGAHLFATRDGGDSWQRQSNGVPVHRVRGDDEPRRPREVVPLLEPEPATLCLTAVHFADARRGWATGAYRDDGVSVVLGTRDGGETWAVERTVHGEELQALFALDSTHAWAAGDRVREGRQRLLRYRPPSP